MTPINEIIHTKLFDKKWHSYKDGHCCGVEIMNTDQLVAHTNPDYTSDAGQGAILRVLGEKKQYHAFEKFLNKYYDVPFGFVLWIHENPTERNRLLAQFLTEVM